MENKIFDCKGTYEKEIRPLVDDLEKKCRQNDLPMFLTVCIANNDENTEYDSVMLSPKNREFAIKNDKISEHIKIATGKFRATLASEVQIGIDCEKSNTAFNDLAAVIQDDVCNQDSGSDLDIANAYK